MKKFALVLAMFLAAGAAQAQVSVYGKVRQYVDNDKVGTAAAVTAGLNSTSNKLATTLSKYRSCSLIVNSFYCLK